MTVCVCVAVTIEHEDIVCDSVCLCGSDNRA